VAALPAWPMAGYGAGSGGGFGRGVFPPAGHMAGQADSAAALDELRRVTQVSAVPLERAAWPSVYALLPRVPAAASPVPAALPATVAASSTVSHAGPASEHAFLAPTAPRDEAAAPSARLAALSAALHATPGHNPYLPHVPTARVPVGRSSVPAMAGSLVQAGGYDSGETEDDRPSHSSGNQVGGGGFLPAASLHVNAPSIWGGPATPPPAYTSGSGWAHRYRGSSGDEERDNGSDDDKDDDVIIDQTRRLPSRLGIHASLGAGARQRAAGESRKLPHQPFKQPRMLTAGSDMLPISPTRDYTAVDTSPRFRRLRTGESSASTASPRRGAVAGSLTNGAGGGAGGIATPAAPRRVLDAYPPLPAAHAALAKLSVYPGLGLANLGNTCFMNASLQVSCH